MRFYDCGGFHPLRVSDAQNTLGRIGLRYSILSGDQGILVSDIFLYNLYKTDMQTLLWHKLLCN